MVKVVIKRKQIYMITYPTNKIYIGKDMYGSSRYFGSPDAEEINKDFEKLPIEKRMDFTVRKQILFESTDCSDSFLSQKEVEFIRKHESNNPKIGYNKWPKFNASSKTNEQTSDIDSGTTTVSS